MVHIFIEDDKKPSNDLYDINSKIKPIDKESANAEIEKNELILKPDMSGLYRALGKPHSKGGTPVNLEDGSFIFSNDKSLSVTPAEKKLFEIDDNTTKKKFNTPAQLLKRIVNPQEYNTLVQVLQDPNKDQISKNAAAVMLQKYLEKIGNIAYLQETKKDSSIPTFSQGTAPIYNDDLREAIDQQPQYMKKGGFFQRGGSVRNTFDYNNLFSTVPYPERQSQQQYQQNKPVQVDSGIYMSRNGERTPTGQSPVFNYPTGIINVGQAEDEITQGLIPEWQSAGVNINALSNREAQSKMYDWALQNNPEILRNMWTQYGITNKGKREGLNTNDLSDSNLKRLKSAYTDGLLGARTFGPTTPSRPLNPSIPSIQRTQVGSPAGTSPTLPNSNPFTRNPTAATLNSTYQSPEVRPYNPEIPFSPLQQLNVLYAGAQALTVPKFYPTRPQIQSPLIELERQNPQSTLNQIDNAAYQAFQANQVLNPTLAAANNASIFGRALDAKVQATGQFENQNVQIANQQNIANNQIQRQDLQQNIAFNQQFNDRVNATNQNYANERRFATNRVADLVNQYASQNAQLSTFLQSQQQFTKPVTDAAGNQLYNKQGQPVLQSQGLFGANLSGFTPQIYYTGAGGLDNVTSRANTGDFFNTTLDSLIGRGVDPKTASIVAGRLSGSSSALQNSVPNIRSFRKGGKYKK